MLQNVRVTAFTVFELSRENQQEGESIINPSPPRLGLNLNIGFGRVSSLSATFTKTKKLLSQCSIVQLNVQKDKVDIIPSVFVIPSCFKKFTCKDGTKIAPSYFLSHAVFHINISTMTGLLVFKHHILFLLKTGSIKNLPWSYFQM